MKTGFVQDLLYLKWLSFGLLQGLPRLRDFYKKLFFNKRVLTNAQFFLPILILITLPDGVMVAQRFLVPFVEVRILVGQPFLQEALLFSQKEFFGCGMFACVFFD